MRIEEVPWEELEGAVFVGAEFDSTDERLVLRFARDGKIYRLKLVAGVLRPESRGWLSETYKVEEYAYAGYMDVELGEEK